MAEPQTDRRSISPESAETEPVTTWLKKILTDTAKTPEETEVAELGERHIDGSIHSAQLRIDELRREERRRNMGREFYTRGKFIEKLVTPGYFHSRTRFLNPLLVDLDRRRSEQSAAVLQSDFSDRVLRAFGAIPQDNTLDEVVATLPKEDAAGNDQPYVTTVNNILFVKNLPSSKQGVLIDVVHDKPLGQFRVSASLDFSLVEPLLELPS